MYKHGTFIFAFLLFASTGYGQPTKNKEKVKTEKVTTTVEQQSNSYAPFAPEETQEVVSPTKTKKSKNKMSSYQKYNITMEQKVEEFKKRMETNAKEKKKQQKKMRKPQYADPSYFGHKRKPKIRKVKNRKYCKECGITH